MHLKSTILIIGLALVLSGLVACGLVTSSSRSSIPLATLWYLLYGYDPATGACIGGIESTVWLRPQDTVYLPEDGLYCSGDDDHIAYAIGKMKEAGIDTIWLSWLYNGDVDFDTVVNNLDFQAADVTALKILQYLNLNEPTMKVAMLVEPFTIPGIDPDDVTIPQKQIILDYLWDRFYSVFPNQIYNVGGKPLVFTWRPPEGRWLLSDTNDVRFTFKEWGVISEGADWEMSAAQGLDGMKIGADGTIWLFPRFDEFYMWINGHPGLASREFSELVRQDPRLTDLLYDSAWKKAYDNSDDITLITVYGWNPWAESAQLEPAFVGPYPNGNLLLHKTSWYYQRFLEGKDFELYMSP